MIKRTSLRRDRRLDAFIDSEIEYQNENEEEPAAEQPLKKLHTSRREEPAAAPPARQIVHRTAPKIFFI